MTRSPCICCDAPHGHEPGTPQVCGDCWDELSRFERAKLWGDAKSVEFLQCISIKVEHQNDHAVVLAGLKRSIEKLYRLVKPVADEIDDLAGSAAKMIHAFDQIARRELDDDSDDWKNST